MTFALVSATSAMMDRTAHIAGLEPRNCLLQPSHACLVAGMGVPPLAKGSPHGNIDPVAGLAGWGRSGRFSRIGVARGRLSICLRIRLFDARRQFLAGQPWISISRSVLVGRIHTRAKLCDVTELLQLRLRRAVPAQRQRLLLGLPPAPFRSSQLVARPRRRPELA